MGESIKERGGDLGVVEDAGPFAESEIGDDDGGSLVKFLSRWNRRAPPEALNGRYPGRCPPA
jgi:hypothetical protein